MVKGKILFNGEDLSTVYDIRRKVFVEEQGISPEDEFDDIDEFAIHAIVYNEELDEPVATGRVYFDGSNYKIGRVAVLISERKKGYGDFVVRMLINKAFMAGADEIHINAQKAAVPFYQKIGFRMYGDEFLEDHIVHVSMKIISGELCKKCSGMDK